jgi:uncharacterized protein YuzB (UPF0349 family)
MTFEEIKRELSNEELLEIIHMDGVLDKEDCNSLRKDFPNLSEFEIVESQCNSDVMYLIFHFVEENIYIKVSGEYDSYGNSGHEFLKGIYQVFPKEITKTIYQ